MAIRFATENDGKALLNIYAQYIDTPVTFECKLPTEREFSDRIADIAKKYPYLVCEENDRIVGYAYAHSHMEREAYQWDAALSIYLDEHFTSKGLGTRLYRTLIDILIAQGFKTVYAGVTVPNPKSESLHVSLGFQPVGTYRKTGYKNGEWHDVRRYEKQIAPYDFAPAPIEPITRVAREKLFAAGLEAGRLE